MRLVFRVMGHKIRHNGWQLPILCKNFHRRRSRLLMVRIKCQKQQQLSHNTSSTPLATDVLAPSVSAPKYLLVLLVAVVISRVEMKTAKFSALVIFLGAFFLGARPCRADQVLDLSGTVVTVGNNASNCNPNPCTIVTNFSFQITFGAPQAALPPFGSGYYLPFTTTVSYKTLSSLANASGFDVPWSQIGVNPVFLGQTVGPSDFLALPGFPGEVDLDFGLGATTNGTVIFDDGLSGPPFVQWYSCLTSTCIQDFIQPQYQSAIGIDECYGDCAEQDASSVQLLGFSAVLETPEPPVSALLAIGAVLVFPVWSFRRRVPRSSDSSSTDTLAASVSWNHRLR
jgi:hypothetical protein